MICGGHDLAGKEGLVTEKKIKNEELAKLIAGGMWQVVKEKNSDFLIVEITVWENHEMDYFLGRFGDRCERLN